TTASRPHNGDRTINSPIKSAANAAAGRSNVAVSAAKNPATAYSHAGADSSDQIRNAAAVANSAHQAAGEWLFSVVANVVRNVPKHAVATTYSRPQSVVPSGSTKRDNINKNTSIGTAFSVNRMTRITIHS